MSSKRCTADTLQASQTLPNDWPNVWQAHINLFESRVFDSAGRRRRRIRGFLPKAGHSRIGVLQPRNSLTGTVRRDGTFVRAKEVVAYHPKSATSSVIETYNTQWT